MRRYFIEEVKCDVFSGGPDPGVVCATVKYSNGNTTKWITNVEVDGFPNFYLTDEDIFDRIRDINDEEFQESLDKYYINDFDGIELGEYEDIVASLIKNEKNPAVSLIKYVIAVTRGDFEITEELITTGKGKNADELKIEMSDLDLDE